MVVAVIPSRLHLVARRPRSTEGLVPRDISLTALRTTRYPSYNRRNPYKFSKPPVDAAFTVISLNPLRQINGTVPKDRAYNHVTPIINGPGLQLVHV